MTPPLELLGSMLASTALTTALAADPSCLATSSIPLTAAITRPTNGSMLMKPTVTVWVKATGGEGVKEVKLYIDGKWYASRTSMPWRFAWDAKKSGPGPHLLVAQARDHAGHCADSPGVLVYPPD